MHKEILNSMISQLKVLVVSAIKYSRRGRRTIENRNLSIEKERQVKLILIDKTSDQMKFPFALWTRDAMNSELLIKFMVCLTKDARRKVFLILDNLCVHHSKKVTKWLEEHKKQIALLYLSSYSTELNPDEYLNGNFKNEVNYGTPIRKRDDLKKNTRSFMRTRVKQSAHVRSYLRHPKVAYAV